MTDLRNSNLRSGGSWLFLSGHGGFYGWGMSRMYGVTREADSPVAELGVWVDEVVG